MRGDPGDQPTLAALQFFVREANADGWLCHVASLILFPGGVWLTGGAGRAAARAALQATAVRHLRRLGCELFWLAR